MTEPKTAPRDPQPPTPWWRVGMVWVVVGGPLAVVIAALVTAAIAAAGADDILTERGATGPRSGASVPAVQARNHAATPKP
jgi:hypothetical protein